MAGYDIAICGAGVGGLASAVALGRQGHRVLLLEKQRQEVPVHKGEFIQPRTLQIFQEWDVLPNLLSRGALRIDVLECHGSRGEDLGQLDYRLLPKPFNYGMVHYHPEIKATLLEKARQLVDIRYGSRATGLLRDKEGRIEGVRVTSKQGDEDILAHLTIGADGRASFLRREAGISVHLSKYTHQLLALDLHNVHHLNTHILNFLSKDGIRIIYPMPGARARLYVQIRTGSYQSIKAQGALAWQRSLLATTPGLSIIADCLPQDFSGVQVLGAWHYCAPSWTVPGLVLIGDAAHGVHPMAGQGMNAAIADAWKLSQIVVETAQPGRCSHPMLDNALVCYERERYSIFRHVAGLSHRMSMLYTTTLPLIRRIGYRTVKANRTNKRLQYMVTYNMSGLGIQQLTWLDRLRQLGILSESHASVAES